MNRLPHEVLYNVALLDDLHNYFPALLYEPRRFQSVQDVLQYIASQTRRRFDLYSYGLNGYDERRTLNRNSDIPTRPPQNQFYNRHTYYPQQENVARLRPRTVVASTSTPPPTQATTTSSSPAATRPPSYRYTYDTVNLTPNILTAMAAGFGDLDQSDGRIGSLANLASILLSAETIIPQNLEPVVVRPTAAQIESATRVATPTTTEDCAICQDSITTNQQCRQILHCQHWFHKDCIDPWFRQNVQCPICRYDIRGETPRQTLNPESDDETEEAN